jgi:hypothetical protein
LEQDSNKTDKSERQSEKQPEPRIVTLRGITIDRIGKRENAQDLICSNRELDSNRTDESVGHTRKNDDSKGSIVNGIQTREKKFIVCFKNRNITILTQFTISLRKKGLFSFTSEDRGFNC